MATDPIETITVDLEIYGIPQTPDMPPMTDTYLHVRRRQDGSAQRAVIGLPAYQGEPGPAGPPGAIHKGERTTAQLTALGTSYGQAQLNWAYRNTDTNAQYVWRGDGWVVYQNAYGLKGDKGDPPTLQPGTVSYDGAVAGDAVMEITGSAGGPYALHLDLPEPPEGPVGPPGPSGSVIDSVDVDGDPTDGQSLRWRSADGKLHWFDPPSAIEEYVVPPSGFPAAFDKASTVTRQQLVAVTIPAKTYPYRFDFSGGVDVKSNAGHQIDLEIRRDDAVSGAIVGYGKGQDGEGWREVALRAHSDVAIQPGSAEGVVQPGTIVNLYLSAVKKAGVTLGWSYRPDLAQLRVRLTRVA
ncbi:hypothetical protein SAMN05444374_11617 [Rhodococcoides kroppenstedtii]|uniref:Minor tail protein n=1 Tax=Rhodococcoides kroppenstedtii TaxID=293050 RepID=A0A1I0U9I6_9NOCA|nr:hypothetical protein [Rhodococcus kroppenstedtii]SFA60759.1 hypothetical protein SAMN05444374_11617 [Rhodococcus kroppenstedtii]